MTWSTTTTFSWWAQRKSFTSAPTRSGCRRTWVGIEKCWIILWKCFPHTKFKHRYFAISQIAAGYFFLFILDVWIRVKNTITKFVFKIPWCFSLLWSWEFFWCRNCSNWEQVGTPCTTKWRLEHPPTGKKLNTVNEILLSFRFDALTKKMQLGKF